MEPTYVDDLTRQFSLSSATTALVVVDMQYASGSREHGLGAMLARQGRLADAAVEPGADRPRQRQIAASTASTS